MASAMERLREYLAAWDVHIHDGATFHQAALDPWQDDIGDVLAVALAVPGALLLGQFPEALRIKLVHGEVRNGHVDVRAADSMWKIEQLTTTKPDGKGHVLDAKIVGFDALVGRLLFHLGERQPLKMVKTERDDPADNTGGSQ